MLIKDEIKFEQKLNQGKAIPSKKDQGSRKKKLIALREVRHMLDEVSTRRTILHKENEETRKAITSMRAALMAMPKEICEERAKLMSRQRQTKEAEAAQQGSTMKMVNENIRETLYAMNLTMSSNNLLTNFRQIPCGQPNLPLPLSIPSMATQSASFAPAPVPSIIGSGMHQ